MGLLPPSGGWNSGKTCPLPHLEVEAHERPPPSTIWRLRVRKDLPLPHQGVGTLMHLYTIVLILYNTAIIPVIFLNNFIRSCIPLKNDILFRWNFIHINVIHKINKISLISKYRQYFLVRCTTNKQMLFILNTTLLSMFD